MEWVKTSVVWLRERVGSWRLAPGPLGSCFAQKPGLPSFTPNQAKMPRSGIGAAWPAALQASLLLHRGHNFLQTSSKSSVPLFLVFIGLVRVARNYISLPKDFLESSHFIVTAYL